MTPEQKKEILEKGESVKHPAKYSKEILKFLDENLPNDGNILDVFAGTGLLKTIRKNALLIEIEPEWASINGAIVGDATNLPFRNETIDCVCTSPTYGNRMADSFIDHQKDKKYIRNTYTHALGRKLHSNNSGAMHFGESYKRLHVKAWIEASRVLKVGGLFYLNVSNFIKNGNEIEVCDWHKQEILNGPFELVSENKIKTKRNGFGANRDLRVDSEIVFVFKKV